MPEIMRWLKGRTARVANRLLDRTGTAFWQDESLDHWARSADEVRYLIRYVENNPVRAGLVAFKEQWPWSSATSGAARRGAQEPADSRDSGRRPAQSGPLGASAPSTVAR